VVVVSQDNAGRKAEIAVDQIRTISKKRLGRQLDRHHRPGDVARGGEAGIQSRFRASRLTY